MEATDVNLLQHAEVAADTAWAKLVARGAMVVAIPLLIGIYTDLRVRIENGISEGRDYRKVTEVRDKQQEKEASDLDARIDVIDAIIVRAREERLERERRADELARRQQDTANAIQSQLNTLNANVSGLAATVEAMKTLLERQSYNKGNGGLLDIPPKETTGSIN